MADDRIDVKIGASIEGLTAGLNAAREQIEGLAAPVADLATAFSGLGEAIVGGLALDRIVEFSERTAELGEQELHAAETLGMAVASFTALSGAMQIAGLGADSATTAMIRLERAAAEAQKGTGNQADAFQRLGISVTDASGHLKSGEEILLEIADRFKDAPNDINKLGAAFDLIGRGLGTNLVPFLNRGRDGIEELMAAAREAGAPTAEMAHNLDETAEAGKLLGQAMSGLATSLEGVTHFIEIMDRGLTRIVESMTRFLGVTDQAKLDNLTGQLRELQAQLATVEAQITQGGWSHFLSDGLETQKRAIEKQIAELLPQIAELQERIANPAGAAGSGTNPIGAPGAGTTTTNDSGAKDASDLERELNDELRQRVALIQDAAGVSNAYYARLMADERLLLTEGKTSVAQELATEIALEQEKTALRMRSLDDELALYHQGETAYARVEAQKLELTQQSIAAIDALEERAAQQQREQNEKTAREFQQVFVSPVTRSFDELVSGLLTRGQSLGTTLEKVFSNLAVSFIESIAKMMAQWLAFEVVMALPGGGGIASAFGMSGGPLGSLFSGGGLSSLFSGGASAGGGFAAATPALMGVGAAFAEGSWSVPSTGAALVHQGEIILPAGLSDAVRGGNVSIGGGAASANVDLTVQAMDGRSVVAALSNPTTARQIALLVQRWMPVS